MAHALCANARQQGHTYPEEARVARQEAAADARDKPWPAACKKRFRSGAGHGQEPGQACRMARGPVPHAKAPGQGPGKAVSKSTDFRFPGRFLSSPAFSDTGTVRGNGKARRLPLAGHAARKKDPSDIAISPRRFVPVRRSFAVVRHFEAFCAVSRRFGPGVFGPSCPCQDPGPRFVRRPS